MGERSRFNRALLTRTLTRDRWSAAAVAALFYAANEGPGRLANDGAVGQRLQAKVPLNEGLPAQEAAH